jgi:pyruvate dehydrogenase E2 component (dihydrolipoyllysine-residue acetyltransferase)
MAKIDVIMPQMGESIAEGTLSRWIKKVGDSIKRDEPIFEISTDKVDAEIPAPSAGVLAEILVQEGQTVAVQTVVARIETEASAGAAEKKPQAAPSPGAPAPPKPATPTGAPPAPLAPAPAKSPRGTAPSEPPAPAIATPKAAPAAASATTAAESRAVSDATGGNGASETAEERLRRKSTPLVRKMAAEHNVDISTVPGTGLAGRVTKNDILGYIEGGEAGKRVGGEGTAQRPAAPASTTYPPTRPPASLPPAATVDPWPGDRVEPWSRIRKLTADHMVMSRRVSPHVNTVFEIDYTRVAQVRAKKRQDYADRGVSLTYLAFITKVVADNLRKHPVLNSAVSGESTLFRRDVNIGIAVALDWGLIVPVIKHADELSLLGVARAINDLGERARTKKLIPDEVQKGTFTITNPGVFGSAIGTPIINQPQAAILCVGAIGKQPAVITVDGADMIAIRTKGMLSLAFDHRIVDGADADRFMADVKAGLQEFPESGA